MVVENKRKAEESALVPVSKKSKNEIALAGNKKALIQSVSICMLFIALLYSIVPLIF